MTRDKDFESQRKIDAQRLLDMTREMLASTKLRSALGEAATKLEQIASMARVPDIIDGRIIDLPDYFDTDVFPFVLADVNETLELTMIDLMPRQVVQGEAFIGGFSQMAATQSPQAYEGLVSKEDIEKIDSSAKVIVAISDKEDALMYGAHQLRAFVNGVQFIGSRRPLVMISRTEDPRKQPFAAIHEVVHAHQTIETPVVTRFTSDERLSSELQAYSAVAVSLQGIYSEAEAKHIDPLSLYIEAIRRRHNGPLGSSQQFKSSPIIKNALHDAGLGSIYGADEAA